MRMITLMSAIVLTVSVSTAPSSAQETCTPASYTCAEYGNMVVGGFTLVNQCLRYAGTQNCVDHAPLNQCVHTEVSVKCTRIAEECIDYKHGECRQTRFRYSCFNEDEDMSPAILERTEWGPVQEEIVSECDELDGNAECRLEQTIEVEPAGIRNINRRDFSRAWWRKRREYSCIIPGEGDNDCGPLESDPTCRRVGDSCLVEDANGVCSNREFHYRCGVESGSLETTCEPINVCVGDNCVGVEQETSTSFGDAAAWLNLLATMQNEFRAQNNGDPNSVRFFVGEEKTCSDAPLRDCCNDSGLFAQCSEDNELLWDLRAAGATHYVGTKCQEKILGACVKKRQYHCTYKSKLARVFIEELKRIKGEAWTHGLPNVECGYATIADFSVIDIDQMDLSEVFGDMVDKANVPLQGALKDFYEQRFPSGASDAQDIYTNGGTP